MGIVYEAYDAERRAPVALKTLRALDEYTLARFKNEFRSLADLTHPNLVRLGELYCEANQWFFTMELVEGEHLLSYVRPESEQAPPQALDVRDQPTLTIQLAKDALRARFDEARLRHTLRQLSHGISALHRAGMIHRDIKPSNVVVTKDGRTVLLDFGLVIDTTGHHSTELKLLGTPAYMAPEQSEGGRVG